MSTNANTTESLAVSQRRAAAMLDVTPRTIFALRQRGDLAGVKTGEGKQAKVLITMESLRRYVGGNRVTA